MQKSGMAARVGLIATAMSLVLAMAGCGGGGGESSSSDAPQVEATTAEGVTFSGEPVKVLTMAPLTGAIPVPELIDPAIAYANKINAGGGLNGRELKIITCDEGLDPNKAQACAQTAVDEGVVAVVGGFSSNAGSVLPVLESAEIPWIGPPMVSAEEMASPMSYPLSPGPLGFAALASRAVEDGCESFAVLRYDIPAAAVAVDLINAGLAPDGKQVDAEIKVPTTTTDFSSAAQQASEFDCQFLALPAEQTIGVAAAGTQLGLENRYYALAGAVTDTALAAAGPALEGVVSAVPYPAKSSSVWDEARAALPEDTDLSFVYLQNVWAAYAAFADVASEVDDLTAANLIKALDSATAVDPDGIIEPVDFANEFPVPGLNRAFNTNLYFVRVVDGKIEPDGDPVDVAPLMGG